jgi:hypothetical protein
MSPGMLRLVEVYWHCRRVCCVHHQDAQKMGRKTVDPPGINIKEWQKKKLCTSLQSCWRRPTSCQVSISVLQRLTQHSEKSMSSKSGLHSWSRFSCFESRPGHRLSRFFHDFIQLIQASTGTTNYISSASFPALCSWAHATSAVAFDSGIYLYTCYILLTITNDLIFDLNR